MVLAGAGPARVPVARNANETVERVEHDDLFGRQAGDLGQYAIQFGGVNFRSR